MTDDTAMTSTSLPPGHDQCGAKARSGKPCRRPAGWGTDHTGIGRCKLHGGSTPSQRKWAEKELAKIECQRLGVEVEVDPGDALIRAVWEAEGNLAYYRAQVNQLDSLVSVELGPGGATKQASHVIVQLYHEAERWRATVAASALRAGVEERRLRLVENDSRFLFDGVLKALSAANVTEAQGEVFRNVLAEHIRGIQPSLGTS
jgi:hypothetical protein